MTAIAFGSLSFVAKTKGLPPDMAEHVAKLVEAIIARDFPPNVAGKERGQRQIAKRLGISQPVLSKILNRDGGIGVHALLALRNYTGQTIDAVLGLASAPRAAAPQTQLDAIQQRVDEMAAAMAARPGGKPSRNSKAGRIHADLERERNRVAAQKFRGPTREERERTAAVSAPPSEAPPARPSKRRTSAA